MLNDFPAAKILESIWLKNEAYTSRIQIECVTGILINNGTKRLYIAGN